MGTDVKELLEMQVAYDAKQISELNKEVNNLNFRLELEKRVNKSNERLMTDMEIHLWSLEDKITTQEVIISDLESTNET